MKGSDEDERFPRDQESEAECEVKNSDEDESKKMKLKGSHKTRKVKQNVK